MQKQIQLIALSLLVATAAQAAQQQRTPPPPPPEQSAAPANASQAETMMQRLKKPQKRDLSTALRLMNGQTIAHAAAAPAQSKPVQLKSKYYARTPAQPKVESKQ